MKCKREALKSFTYSMSYLYAETAFHHEGDFNYLLRLVDAAVSAGCHGIKFQVLIDIDEFMSSHHDSYNKSREWLFTYQQWTEVLSYAQDQGLDIVLMPLDTSAFGSQIYLI